MTTPQTQKDASHKAFTLKYGIEYPEHGAAPVLLADKQVATMIGGSRATVWRRVSDGTLPKPIKFGGMTRWLLSEVEAAIARRVAARDAEGV